MKKILVIIQSLRGGGLQRWWFYLSSYGQHGVEYVFAVLEPGVNYPFKSTIYFLGDYKRGNFFEFMRFLIKIYKLARIKKTNILVGSSARGRDIVAYLFPLRNRVLLFDNYVTPLTQGRLAKIQRRLKDRVLFPTAKRMIAVSKEIMLYLFRNYKVLPNKVKLMYGMVDTESVLKQSLEPIDEELSEVFKPSSPVIISVGRLERQKAHWHLIRSFRVVTEIFPQSKFIIIGEGPLKSYLEQLIIGLDLQRSVLLLGWQNNPFKYMARSYLFCLPSQWEGLPNVIVEAMTCGLPVMSADCLSGPREIIAPGTEYKVEKLIQPEYGQYGILMPVFDGKRYSAKDPLTWQERVWAEEIIRVLNNPSLIENYRKKGPERARDFDVKKIVPQYTEFFLSL